MFFASFNAYYLYDLLNNTGELTDKYHLFCIGIEM